MKHSIPAAPLHPDFRNKMHPQKKDKKISKKVDKEANLLPEEEDWLPKWSRRSWSPFTRRWMFEDIVAI